MRRIRTKKAGTGTTRLVRRAGANQLPRLVKRLHCGAATAARFSEISTRLYCQVKTQEQTVARLAVFTFGFFLLLNGLSEPAAAYDGSKYLGVCKNLISLVEGGFGAMLTAVAGVGAIVASAMGGFKMAWACVVVSVGAFVLRAYMTLFFENCG